ncbi:MAG: EAL domain-containing protein [Magnetospirillum sp.]|nr:EAL domain-containing protein [Magnetospirillum sp.]
MAEKNLPYIEPTIRTIAGTLVTASGVVLYYDYSLIAFVTLFFVSLNLAQSGLTRFCLMELLLRKMGFRSELDEIRDLNQAMAATEAEAASNLETLNMVNEVVVGVSSDLTLHRASKPIEVLLGTGAETVVGMPITDVVHDVDRPLVRAALSKLFTAPADSATVRFRLAPKGPNDLWVEGKFVRRAPSGGGSVEIRGVLRDITESHLQEQRIVHMALHDALTGLPNRVLLEDRMQQALNESEREGVKCAVIFVDLDNFKQVNDVYGHKAGDQLLVEVTQALTANLRKCDTLARWGGDEFVILLPKIGGLEDLKRKADRLAAAVRAHLEEKNADYDVTLSLGGALYPDDARTAENLLIQADKALFFAKSQGRNNAQMFAEMSSNDLGYRDVDFTADFAAAVKNDLIQVHYQPIVDAHTHLPVGMEALARWQDPQYGWVSPATFIPMAETLGVIERLGQSVLEQALRQFSSCEKDLARNMFLSINVSNRQLVSNTFVPDLMRSIERHSVNPQSIKLEMTESVALLGIERARELLIQLSEAGFMLSLDDFGTGYSSLSYLHDLPVHEIKIDASFVRRVHTEAGRVLLRTITDLGHAMKMNVVAEGVETKECADVLTDMGVDMLQGYYFKRPGPKEECLAYVASCRGSLETQI